MYKVKRIAHQDRDIKTMTNAIKNFKHTNLMKHKMTYNFLNHFHPYVGDFIEKLNSGSIEGLLDIKTQEMEKDFFKGTYTVNDDNDDSGFDINPEPMSVDLSVSGAYALYNWELFFHVPMMIAVHLSKNQRFAEAQKWFHFIFDPTSNDQSVEIPKRFWKFKHFKETTDIKMIDEMLKILSKPDAECDNDEKALKKEIETQIDMWRDKPFEPHTIGRLRPLAYQLQVVEQYIHNLVAWGDNLYRQDTRETLDSATQLYVLATNILGERPQEVPKQERKTAQTFYKLKNNLDAFRNASVEMEGELLENRQKLFGKQHRKEISGAYNIGRTLYFCIPKNEQLLAYWDKVADRLFKIRHCMNIEGKVRQLPLFQPPIDPGMLVKAAAAGIDLSSVISSLNQPVSNIRAPLLIQKALEICSDVKSLGNSLLSVIEKKESEQLSLLRQEQEISILNLVEDVKFLQWKESENATKALLKSRESAYERFRHSQLLLGKKEEDLKEIKKLEVESVELSEENFDEIHKELIGQYEKEIILEEYVSGKVLDGNLYLNENENAELNQFMPAAYTLQQGSSSYDIMASAYSLMPQIGILGAYLGVGASKDFGGVQLSKFASIEAQTIRLFASHENYKASRASKQASYQRRAEDWTLQSNLAAKELMSIGQQVISSLIREQITKKEYENHKYQIKNTIEIETFMKEKFSNEQFYTWMQSKISKVYYENYKFAFDIAKKAEQTMKHELMREEADERDFIKFNYWDAGRKGLLSGEGLYLDIKRMEMAYHEYNKREYELTKHISLQQLDSMALLKLKVEGSCEITIPEWLFDMDCPGHYMRRIKTVSLSIPCVVGSYTSINCTLSLQKSTLRKSSLLKDNEYKRDFDSENEDTRFVDKYGTIQSIVTSNAQNDSGVFELNLRDEKYLPFEGAGAESTWRLELPSEFRQFDYSTISDVIIDMRYTAREGGGLLKTLAETNIKSVVSEVESTQLVRMFNLQHDFPNEWHLFLSNDEDFKVTLKKEHFPYLVQNNTLSVKTIELISIPDFTKPDVTKTTSPSGIDLSDLNNNINNKVVEEKSEISFADDVLQRDKDANVFLLIRYILEEKT